jgi:hypothetical protein
MECPRRAAARQWLAGGEARSAGPTSDRDMDEGQQGSILAPIGDGLGQRWTAGGETGSGGDERGRRRGEGRWRRRYPTPSVLGWLRKSPKDAKTPKNRGFFP